MTQGLFRAQLNDIEKILSELDLLAERETPSYNGFGRAALKGKPYLECWQYCLENYKYDFRLNDDSILQFHLESINPLELTYSYYECPFYPTPSFNEYYEKQQLLSRENIDEYELLREFEMIIPQAKPSATPVRYDYKPSDYLTGRHPASHVHIGFENNVRVSTKNILKPISFMLFIIRQYYTNKWMKLVVLDNADIICKNVADGLDIVDAKYFNKYENWEMHLS